MFFSLIIVAAVGIGLFFDVNKFKPQIEAAVDKATGMEFKINGKASLKVLPTVHVALDDVHFRNPAQAGKAADVFSAQEISVSPQLLPFVLHRELNVDQLSLISPKIQIEKNKSGKYNFESAKAEKTQAAQPPQKGTSQKSVSTASAQSNPQNALVRSVVVKDADLSYVDQTSGQNLQVKDVTVRLSDIALNDKQLSLKGNLKAQSLKSGTLNVSDIQADFKDNKGLIDLKPTELTTFGGKISGNAQIDLRGGTPKMKIEQSGDHIDLAQASGRSQVSGVAEAKIDLTAQGKDPAALTHSLNGTVAIRSKDITVTGMDIDSLAGNLKTGQGLGLVNIGSSLMAGPVGGVGQDISKNVGKAGTLVNGASGAANSVTKSQIRNLVSVWKITNGIAQAQDAAFTTGKHTIAFKGDLDLVNKKYQNFYIATVDAKGCSQQKVEVEGPLSSPKPNAGSIGTQVAKSYLGSGGSALASEGKSIAGLFNSGGGSSNETANKTPDKSAHLSKAPQAGCDQFYQGSALHTA